MSTTYSGRILHTKKHNRKIHNCRTFITDDKHGGEKKHMEHTGRSVKKDVYIKISTANEICSTKTCCHFQNCFKIIPKWKKKYIQQWKHKNLVESAIQLLQMQLSNTPTISSDWVAIVISTENTKIPGCIPGIARVKQLFQEIFQMQSGFLIAPLSK